MNPARLAALPLFVLASAAPRAQELRYVDGTPPVRFGCYDPVRQRVITIGSSNYSNEWDGAIWRRAADVGAQPGFLWYDRARQHVRQLIEYDWYSSTSTFVHRERVGSSWQTATVAGAPSLRVGMALAHDTTSNTVLAFGGMDVATGTMLGDTWRFDGVAWTLVATTGPAARNRASLAYDTARQRMVLFGGYDQTAYDDTWEWDGTTWQAIATAHRPPGCWLVSMAFDAARARTVLLTGVGAPVAHFEYDGTDWSAMPALPAAIANLAVPGALVYDDARAETLLVGGFGTHDRQGFVFAWNGAQWSPRPGLGYLPSPGIFASVAPSLSGTGIYRFGGGNYLEVPSNDLWTFANGAWTLTASGTIPARGDAAMWTTPTATFVFGGVNVLGGPIGDFWRWNGAAWASLPTAGAPSYRRSAACAYDPVANRALLFGGYDGTVLGDTWTFDGVVWQQHTSGPQPPARYDAAMAYDLLLNRTVLTAGKTFTTGPITTLTDTWEWNGTGWQLVPTAIHPGVPGAMAFDFPSQRIVFVESSPAPSVLSYDGATWTTVPVVGGAGSATPIATWLPRAVTGPTGRVTVVDHLGVRELVPTPAAAKSYGSACGPAAELAAAALPRVGDAAFAFDLTGVPPNAPALLAGAPTAASLPFAGCTVLVTPGFAAILTLASASGFATVSLPLPNNPALIGQLFFFQAVTLAPATPLGLAFSEGLRIALGQ
ncbi:MAG TPA: hypothetical protein VFD82_13110 [Planctomycetota bacterium]|nr:hypothetical protein [Planctomycetota bacterium]